MKRPALFLDRDGVINIDYGYVHRDEDFQFIDGIFDLVNAANQSGYLVVVVTNQAGIGRGYYTEEDFFELTEWMCEQFALYDAKIDAVYFCPYHPEYGLGKYRRESKHRKPGPGMLLDAARDLNIDLTRSIIVGDKASDLEAGHRAGVGTLLCLGCTPSGGIGESIKYLSDAIKRLR
jgi:D-glycero-D-manno-heptose 1,7-bisphosphate phosphatase